MTRPDLPVGYGFDRRLRVGTIGAGGHSQRNVHPSLQYAPVDLVAVCDLDEAAAVACARRFGALRHYTDAMEMLATEAPEAVFIVTGYEPDGCVQATALAHQALDAGCHVWMEKPTAATVDEVEQLMAHADNVDRRVMTGLKKVFTPAIEKAKQLISSEQFGQASSIAVRYPQSLPQDEERVDLRAMNGFLDHLYHPAAVLGYLMGPIAGASYVREPFNGGSVTTLSFRSGAIGTMHLAAGSAGTSPLERVEVVGEGCNLVIDNGVELTYYRRTTAPVYGRSASYLVDDASAPLRWSPEFSLGQLYNKNIFYQGYVPEIVHFCRAIIEDIALTRGTLADSLEIMRLFEFYRHQRPGTWAGFDPPVAPQEQVAPWKRTAPCV